MSLFRNPTGTADDKKYAPAHLSNVRTAADSASTLTVKGNTVLTAKTRRRLTRPPFNRAAWTTWTRL
jgi:hypothetical protein